MDAKFKQEALDFHSMSPTGKVSSNAIKSIRSLEELALAYSPGVGACIQAIEQNPSDAYKYTNISHTCAVITNATAVLGYGTTSPRASKPVMEGKAAIIKSFSGLDAFDLEIDEKDPDKFIDIVRALSPSFGAILLEDIKAPDCFHIEQTLQEKCNIPIFHDDQHGTAIVVAAGLINAAKVQEKDLTKSKLCIVGSGAAGYAIFHALIALGMTHNQIIVCDSKGPIISSRSDFDKLSKFKKEMLNTSFKGTQKDAIRTSDIVIGVAAAGIITEDDIKEMPAKPIIFALSNPHPEILPSIVKEHRPDAIVATGRSDFPNQVNNVLVFPYLLKGLIRNPDARLNAQMKSNVARFVADLVTPGKERILPDIFDERLQKISSIVSEEQVHG